MGTAVATDAASHLSPPAQGLILCEGFPSLREAATCIASISLLAKLLPDIWRTVDIVQTLTQPLLIVHSDSDRLFPTEFSHNEPYQNPRLTYWQPILDFISRHAALHANASSLHSQAPSS